MVGADHFERLTQIDGISHHKIGHQWLRDWGVRRAGAYVPQSGEKVGVLDSRNDPRGFKFCGLLLFEKAEHGILEINNDPGRSPALTGLFITFAKRSFRKLTLSARRPKLCLPKALLPSV
jgi:hypothetical protein